MLLCLAEVGDGLGERGKSQHERDCPHRRVVGGYAKRGQQSASTAETSTGRARTGDAAVGYTCSAVIAVGCAAEDPAAEHSVRRTQGIGSSPGCIRRSGGIGHGELADLRGGLGGDAGGVLPDGVTLRPGELRAPRGVRVCGGAVPAVAQLGEGQVGCELAAAVPDRVASGCRVAGQGHRVSGDLARVARAQPGAH